jgi:glycosyltransferase involved in cell wall biosynthesis
MEDKLTKRASPGSQREDHTPSNEGQGSPQEQRGYNELSVASGESTATSVSQPAALHSPPATFTPASAFKSHPSISISEPMLASFVVVAYNQEKYIREAVEGAFSQTYSPLEIILSDDCSTDSTFEIMQSMARDYSGPHRVLLNRNERNLGISEHVNKTFALARGEVWIGAAGDDISLPARSSITMAYFSSDPQVMCVTCGANLFGAKHGIVIPWALNRKLHILELCALNLGQQGSTAAYRNNVFTQFPRLSPNCRAEDFALTFRACLIGKRIACPDILVLYRAHDSNIANTASVAVLKQRAARVSLTSMLQAASDLTHYASTTNNSLLLAQFLLRLRIYACEREAHAAEAGKYHDNVADTITRCLSLFKLYRLLHLSSWKEGRILGSRIRSCHEHAGNTMGHKSS